MKDKENSLKKMSHSLGALRLGYLEWLFLISLVVGGIIRLYLAFHSPVDIDENYYAFDGHLLNNGLVPFQDYPSRSPIMFLLSAVVLKMGGDFFALRTLAVIVSITTGALVYLTGKALAGRDIGSIAAIIFLLSPYSIRYGYTFITQPFEALGAGLSFYMIIVYIRRRNTKPLLLFLGGLISALTILIRRTSLLLYPVEIIILYFYFITVGANEKTEQRKDPISLIPFLYLSAGFLSIFITALVFFIYISGPHYTVYFFVTDYIHAHTRIVENLNYTFTAFDTRAFYLLSPGMVFVSVLIYRMGMRLLQRAVGINMFNKQVISILQFILILSLIFGWLLSAFSLLGNNYIDAGDGLTMGLMVLFLMSSGWAASSILSKTIDTSRMKNHLPLYLTSGIALSLIPFAGEEFYFLLDAVILLNMLSVGVMFYHGFASKILLFREEKMLSSYFPVGVYLLMVLMFYLGFRVMLPYYYDLLFPLCIITALLFRDILRFNARNEKKEWKEILITAKVVFVATLLLATGVSITAYYHEKVQSNQLKISILMECSDYLRENGREGEEILTAKPVIALQANMEIVFNIVRAAVYKENSTETLKNYNYPTIHEIQDYLEKNAIRFVIVEPGLKAYILDVYPNFRDYIDTHYHTVAVFGEVEIRERG